VCNITQQIYQFLAKNMKTAGIIGGLGPETTAEFYLALVSMCQEKNKINLPPIIISSCPIPYKLLQDAIVKNINLEKFLSYLLVEAKRLEKSGADFIIMPCNSLHIFINEIRSTVNIPVLSIIEETVNFLKKEKMNKVGIVSTTITTQNRLYENAFSKNNIIYFAPDNKQQSKLGKIVYNIVMGNKNKNDREQLMQIINNYENKNVDCVILACTDLQLLKPAHPKLKIFDTMKIFANTTVDEIINESRLDYALGNYTTHTSAKSLLDESKL